MSRPNITSGTFLETRAIHPAEAVEGWALKDPSPSSFPWSTQNLSKPMTGLDPSSSTQAPADPPPLSLVSKEKTAEHDTIRIENIGPTQDTIDLDLLPVTPTIPNMDYHFQDKQPLVSSTCASSCFILAVGIFMALAFFMVGLGKVRLAHVSVNISTTASSLGPSTTARL